MVEHFCTKKQVKMFQNTTFKACLEHLTGLYQAHVVICSTFFVLFFTF